MSSKSMTTLTRKDAKSKAVPKLRFPEFRAAAAWESKLIGPYLEDCSGRVPPDTELPVYSSTREGLKRQDAYFDGRVLQNKNEYGVVPPGCFVYRHMSDDGLFKFNINETGGEIAVSKEYPVFKTKGLAPAFLLARLNDGLDFKHFALSQKAGGTRTRLYFSRLCEWRTLLPSPAEQQKIAECLSSIDGLMAAQARKVAALKTHKDGLMQQLFPRDGETQPRLRFPEFRIAGKWECKTLRDIAKITSGSTPSRSNPEFFVGGSIPWVKTTDLNNSFITETEEKVAPKANIRTNPVGSVLIAMYGGFNQIGRTGCLTFPAATNQAISVLALDQKAVMPAYVLAWLNAKVEVWKRIASSSRKDPNITGSDVASFTIVFPELSEQQRIASCLSGLDDLITAETQKLETLKTHKKGLMQQLFPRPEEAEA